jgi:hypothetical protein
MAAIISFDNSQHYLQCQINPGQKVDSKISTETILNCKNVVHIFSPKLRKNVYISLESKNKGTQGEKEMI